jgi:hypothetical protein
MVKLIYSFNILSIKILAEDFEELKKLKFIWKNKLGG